MKIELAESEQHLRVAHNAEKDASEKAKALEFELKSSNKMTKKLREEMKKLQQVSSVVKKPPKPSYKKKLPSLSLADEMNPPDLEVKKENTL